MPAAEVVRVGLRVGLARLRRRAAEQLDLQFHDHGRRDLVLDGEDVAEIAVECLRPGMRTVGGANELRGDANAICGLAHAAFEQVRDAELPCDLRGADRPPPERE